MDSMSPQQTFPDHAHLFHRRLWEAMFSKIVLGLNTNIHPPRDHNRLISFLHSLFPQTNIRVETPQT
jgi:hypothetical protein